MPDFPNREWFEMSDLKRRDYDRASWVPLCSYGKVREAGKYGHEDYVEEFSCTVAVMFDEGYEKNALSIEWAAVNRDTGPRIEDSIYYIAGTFRDYRSNESGRYLVIQQSFETGELGEWHLDQDLVLALGLWREGDRWLCPQEDYIEVARLRRAPSGHPQHLEMRVEHLKDYLRARNSGVLVAQFHSRKAITAESRLVPWSEPHVQERTDRYRWEGHIYEIHAGGFPYGQEIAVFRAARTDVDYEEDIPVFPRGPDESIDAQHWVVRRKERKLYEVFSKLWKNDWIRPSGNSPRVRGDRVPSAIPFITDNAGNTARDEELAWESRWLWFRPTVVTALLARRGGYLAWYTADTGKLGAAKPYSVHFGVNALGLINVYAKDISYLPETHKKLWVAHNCSPEGQVSREFLMSQMEVKPANTVAPEVSLWRSVDSLQTAFTNKFSRPLFRGTMGEPDARLRIHRFHAIDREGIFYLSKELTRGLIEWFDITSLKELTPSQNNKLGSLKRLEKLVSATGAEGYRIMGPLFAVYDLRIADAHISSSDVLDKSQLLGLAPRADNYVEQGKMLLQKVADTLVTISACLRSNPNP